MIDQVQRIDDIILGYINIELRSCMLDIAMPVFSQIGNLGLIWIVIGLILIFTKKHRMAGIVILSALIIGAVIGDLVIKNLTSRLRPFASNPDSMLLIPMPKGFSFPSGHTVSSFASAAALFIVNIYAGIFGIILACIISFSRLYLYVHYPSDIISGIVLGFLSYYISRMIIITLHNRSVNKKSSMH